MWQHFLRSWVQQQVRQSASEALRAAADGPAPAAERTIAPCDVAVVFALGIEAGGLEDLLEGVLITHAAGFMLREGKLRGRSVAIAEVGVGGQAAAAGTELVIAGHHPAWVISAGFSGGLDGRLRRGDIVIANALVHADGRRLAIDLKLDPSTAGKSLHFGACTTAEAVVCQPAAKAALGKASGALAVDLESWAVGDVCRQAKTRFLCVRIISDAVDERLPPEIEMLARQKSNLARFGAAAGAVFRRPSSIKDMLRLKEDALVFSDRLARFLTGIIEQLPPRQ